MKPLHIAIVGPVATADIAHLLDGATDGLPKGYEGAPLMGTLISELLRLGHRVSAVTTAGDVPLDCRKPVQARGRNFDISYCPVRRRAYRPNGLRAGRIIDLYAFERKYLRQAIERAAPDVVHAHWAYEFSLAALATGLPHVVTCHDSPYVVARMVGSVYRWLRVLMARKVLREAGCVTAVSPYMCEAVQPMTRAPIAVVPNPVDALAQQLARTRAAPAKPHIAMVCNGWDARKNPEPGLRAYARLRADRPESELHLYGRDFGPGQKAQNWAQQQGMDDGMVFHGAAPHKQLLHALADADVLLHPALEESFCMVIAEAMAMGIPVVAGQSSGAVPWVVEGAGELCDVRSEAAIHSALERVLEPAVYSRCSEAGQARVRGAFTTIAVAEAYLSAYRQVLHGAAGPC